MKPKINPPRASNTDTVISGFSFLQEHVGIEKLEDKGRL